MPRKTIATISQDKQVALLFGREDFGLSTDQMSLCQLTASVPMATKNPSLNLAQAVQIFAYEVFVASLDEYPPAEIDYAEVNALEEFYGRVTRLLDKVGMSPYNREWETYLKSLRARLLPCSIRIKGHRHTGHDFLYDLSVH